MYPEFVENPKIVSKSAQDEWLVFLEKQDDTQTNEMRNSALTKHAAFRGSHFLVVKIINKKDPSITRTTICNSVYVMKIIEYEVGQIVRCDDYDDDENVIDGPGIHFFTSVYPAFYFENRFIENGPKLTFGANGRIIAVANYRDGKVHGHYIDYYESNDISTMLPMKTMGYYDLGKKIGNWTAKHLNGNICYIGKYLNGERTGKWTIYNHDKSVREEGSYLDGLMNDEWTMYYSNSNKKSRGCFINGLKDGPWTFWHENGNVEAIRYYVNGMQNGEERRWYPNRREKSCGKYISDQKVGHWITWNEDGTKNSEGNCADDKKEGMWIIYGSCDLRHEGMYVNDIKSGTWKTYIGSTLISSELYSSDGTLICSVKNNNL